MGEAARKIPESQPEDLRELRVIEGNSENEMSVEARALRALAEARHQIENGVDPEAMSDLLNELERLLGLHPRRPMMIKLFPEEEKKDTLEKRKGSVSERLRIIGEELKQSEEKPQTEQTNPLFDRYLQEQRKLFRLEAALILRSKKGETVTEELAKVTKDIGENKEQWEAAVRESKKPQIDTAKKAELELQLEESFVAEGIKARSPEEVAAWEAEKERAVERWVAEQQSKKPVAIPVEKKTSYYPHRHETGKILAEAFRVLEEIKNIEPKLQGEARAEIRKSLEALDKGPTVPEFLHRTYHILSACAQYFRDRNDASDHPLFLLGQLIQELRQHVPVAEQIHHGNFTRIQMQQMREALRKCLASIRPDEDERLHHLIEKMRRNAKNPLTPGQLEQSHRKDKFLDR